MQLSKQSGQWKIILSSMQEKVLYLHMMVKMSLMPQLWMDQIWRRVPLHV